MSDPVTVAGIPVRIDPEVPPGIVRHTSFDAYEADGSPRRYVGMFRPPFEEWQNLVAPWALSYHVPGLRDRWLAGDGDRPLYEAGADIAVGDSAFAPSEFDAARLERLLRQEWWLNHGCPPGAAYGDDGEMSCGGCGFDFKRTPMPDTAAHVAKRRIERGAAAWEAMQRGE